MTCFQIAERFLGIKERPGRGKDHPLIQYAFSLCDGFGMDTHDEVPWCSAFAQVPAFVANVPRSRSAMARSWLGVGSVIDLSEAEVGFDVAIIKRGSGPQPGPEVLSAPGHVGFFAGSAGGFVWILGGNQKDSVSVAPYGIDRLLGIRRLK